MAMRDRKQQARTALQRIVNRARCRTPRKPHTNICLCCLVMGLGFGRFPTTKPPNWFSRKPVFLNQEVVKK